MNWLGRYARFVYPLVVKNVAQEVDLLCIMGGQDKNDGKVTLFLPYYYLLRLLFIIRTHIFVLNVSFFLYLFIV